MPNKVEKSPQEWQTAPPPNETVVEVLCEGEIIEVMAFYGREGYKPHWRTPDGSRCWGVYAFREWRRKS